MNNDYELVYLAKENDEIAIDLLYKKYYKLIYHMVKKYAAFNSQNEDVFFNEANLTFYRAVITYKDSNTFATYLSRCLYSSMSNCYKALNRKKSKILNEALYILDDDTDNSNIIVDHTYDPQRILLEEEACRILKDKIIAELSWKEELVFELKIQNYSPKEIAEITDNNLKTVYNIIKRIRNKIVKLAS